MLAQDVQAVGHQLVVIRLVAVVRISSGIPVRLENSIQISGTRTLRGRDRRYPVDRGVELWVGELGVERRLSFRSTLASLRSSCSISLSNGRPLGPEPACRLAEASGALVEALGLSAATSGSGAFSAVRWAASQAA